MSRWPGCHLTDLRTIFDGASPDSLARLRDEAERRVIPATTLLTKQGTVSPNIYVVREGCLKIAHLTAGGTSIALGFARPGDPIGWPSALRALPCAASARAVTEAVAIGWTTERFEAILADDPALQKTTLRLVSELGDALLARLRELVTEPVEQRLARALGRLARPDGPGGSALTPPISRQDLAELTGTTHFTVSRILKDWEEEGLIANRRPRILVRDLRRMEDRVEESRDASRRKRPIRSPEDRAGERRPAR